MSNVRRKAAIIGGSLTGLITARLLSLSGWDVHVFERVAEELGGRGAGIGTHPEFFDVLRAAELPIRPDAGIRVELRRILAPDGSVALEHRYRQVLMHWDQLFSLLREFAPDDRYHLGRKMAACSQTSDAVTVRFEDGDSLEVDLLIGADGIRSTVRGALCPQAQPQYAGYVAWRGMVPEDQLSHDTRASMFDYFCFGLPVGEQMAGYPIRRVDRGQPGSKRDYNFIWYRPADQQKLDALLTDESGRRHEMNIPPPLIDSRHRRQVKQEAENILAPQFAEAVRLAEGLFCQPIYDVDVPRMVDGRIALLGDAAFVARPHVGAGVTKAFGDALALSRALDRNASVEQALQDFERERLPIGQKILERARHLGAYMQASRGSDAERKSAEAYRRPEAVIRETASMDFLHEVPSASSSIEELSMSAFPTDLELSNCPWPEWVKREFQQQRGNACVGTALSDENERTRVWYLRLPPGERVPFHTHVLDYFWTCVSGGSTRSHVFMDGKFETDEFDLKPGSTRSEHFDAGSFKIHDLENIGKADLLFVTVEHLRSDNAPMAVPSSVKMQDNEYARRKY